MGVASSNQKGRVYLFCNELIFFCVLGVFCFSSYIALFQPFISLWLGEENLLSMSAVIVIAFSSLVTYLRKAVNTFKDAKGLFKQDRYKPIVEAIVGVGLSIGLSYPLGITGVVLGYTLSSFLIAMPVENYVLFKKGFNVSIWKNMLKVFVYIVFAFCVASINYFALLLIPIKGVGGFIVKFLLNIIFNGILIVAFTIRTKEFDYFYNLFASIFNKIKRKICRKR